MFFRPTDHARHGGKIVCVCVFACACVWSGVWSRCTRVAWLVCVWREREHVHSCGVAWRVCVLRVSMCICVACRVSALRPGRISVVGFASGWTHCQRESCHLPVFVSMFSLAGFAWFAGLRAARFGSVHPVWSDRTCVRCRSSHLPALTRVDFLPFPLTGPARHEQICVCVCVCV